MKALFLVLLLFPRVTHGADLFVPDLADKSGLGDNTGIFTLQAGVCFLGSLGVKVLFDGEKRRDVDWLGWAGFTSVSIFVHTQYYGEGGRNCEQAIWETVFESAGAALPLITF